MVNTAVSKPGLDLFSLQEMGALWQMRLINALCRFAEMAGEQTG